jgi:hypothetical protein
LLLGKLSIKSNREFCAVGRITAIERLEIIP